MADSAPHHGPGGASPKPADRLGSAESAKYFEVERREEHRKRFATHSFAAGLFGLLLLLIPNPAPWLLGPIAILLGIHALIRILLQPARHGGTLRAVIGIVLGAIATLASFWP
jgi:uncharacterized membrane protein AbrB (regulator of aidB expression)